MLEGADPDVIYDLSGAGNHGTMGAGGAFKPGRTYRGLEFTTAPQLAAYPVAMADSVRTEYTAITHAKTGHAYALWYPWETSSDGTLHNGDGAPALEVFSAGETWYGDLIQIIRWGTGAGIWFYTDATGLRQVLCYKARGESVFPHKLVADNISWFGYRSPFQYLGEKFYRMAHNVGHTPEQMLKQCQFISQELKPRGITLNRYDSEDIDLTLVFGDSITGNPVYLPGFEYGQWPYQLEKLLGPSDFRVMNYGLSGFRVRDMPAVIADRSAVFASTTGRKRILIQGGVNDLVQDLASSAQIIGYFEDAIAAAWAAGADEVGVVTILGGNYTGLGADQTERMSQVIAVNNAIQSLTVGAQTISYAIDVTATPIGENQNGSDGAFYIDGIHIWPAAHTIIAEEAYDVISAAL